MKSILGESRGLYILQGNVLSLPGFGTEIAELVISDTNPFIGSKVSDVVTSFGAKYQAALITVRAKDFGKDFLNEVESKSDFTIVDLDEKAIELSDISKNNDDKSEEITKKLHSDVVISEHRIAYGDTVLVVTKKGNIEELSHNRDFFVVSSVGKLPVPLDYYYLIPVLVFAVMLILVANEKIEMCPAALTVTAFFFMGGWIKPDDIPKMVDIRLLMLMGCSLSFAKAMTKSGLALKIAESINDSNPSTFGSLMLIYAVTLIITELISNNAAAALMYPIAVALADELGVSFKPFAMAVLVSSTAGFMSPIGYQTHVMVWGPGGYKFKDFVIFGIVPDIIYWLVGCAIIIRMYPF
jgi:di/tricarboxylate transporter